MPGPGIGYIVLPPELINLGRSRKWQSDLHNEVTSQLALARFIQQGFYLKHVGEMRKHYLQRRKSLIRALNENFPDDGMRIMDSATGLHLVVQFQGKRFSKEILETI